jgi:hypothetical protein
MQRVNNDYQPAGDKVFVKDMNFGEQITREGIVLMSDDGKGHGVHPRWAQVHAKGPKNIDDYEVGDWILVEHGRWTRGFTLENDTVVRMIDNDAVLAYDTAPPSDVVLGD